MTRREKEVASKIADRVRVRADRLGLTQAQIADQSDVGLRTISRLFAGSPLPTLQTIVRVADVLGVKPGSLIRE